MFAPLERLPACGAMLPVPLDRAKATGMPSGTKMPPLVVSRIVVLRVRFTRIVEVCDWEIDAGVAVMLRISHGLYVAYWTCAEGLLFDPHQLSLAFMVPLLLETAMEGIP
jgi:hypothetical protein